MTSVVVLGVLAASGCTAATPAIGAAPSSNLGRFPIATPPPVTTPTASPGHAQLVSMGDPVVVTVGDSTVLVTATGPDLPGVGRQPAGGTPPAALPGTITLTAQAGQGSSVIRAADLSVTDELGHSVATSPDVATITATPGKSVALRLSAVFAAGHQTLTWHPAGRPAVTWDYEVELD